MEVPGLGVESELQLPAHATATATPSWSRIGRLRHSFRQGHPWPTEWGQGSTCILTHTARFLAFCAELQREHLYLCYGKDFCVCSRVMWVTVLCSFLLILFVSFKEYSMCYGHVRACITMIKILTNQIQQYIKMKVRLTKCLSSISTV